MPLAFALLVTIVSFLFLIVLLMIVRRAADLPNDTIVYQVNILALGAVVFTVLAGFTGIAVWPNFPGIQSGYRQPLAEEKRSRSLPGDFCNRDPLAQYYMPNGKRMVKNRVVSLPRHMGFLPPQS